MSTGIADIFKRYGLAYLNRFGQGMPPSHHRVMRDILLCRSGLLGWHEYYCRHCKQIHYLNNSCRNRHCPQCQHDKTQKWINKQLDMLLPVEYFLFTFTIPEQLRRLARSNQKLFYNIFFKVSSECLQILARDKRFIGGACAMVGVLHTWTQILQYHPHIHYIVPGIAFDPEKNTLRFARDGFLVHVKALSRLFCFRLKQALIQAGFKDSITTCNFNGKWVVHGKSVGSGEHAIKYLAQYVYRIAIIDQRIISCKNGMVTFRYKDRDSGADKIMSLDALEFIRRFLQHILPRGFQKVRYYGFLHPKKRKLFDQIRLLLLAKLKIPKNHESKRENRVLCPDCGNPMICISTKNAARPPPLDQIFKYFAA